MKPDVRLRTSKAEERGPTEVFMNVVLTIYFWNFILSFLYVTIQPHLRNNSCAKYSSYALVQPVTMVTNERVEKLVADVENVSFNIFKMVCFNPPCCLNEGWWVTQTTNTQKCQRMRIVHVDINMPAFGCTMYLCSHYFDSLTLNTGLSHIREKCCFSLFIYQAE